MRGRERRGEKREQNHPKHGQMDRQEMECRHHVKRYLGYCVGSNNVLIPHPLAMAESDRERCDFHGTHVTG